MSQTFTYHTSCVYFLQEAVVKLQAYWTWDARIIGTGDTPEQDHHLTELELVVPGKYQLILPIEDMLDIMHDPRNGNEQVFP